MMNWYGNGMSGWGYALMSVNMLLFWGLLIGGVVVLVRYLRGGDRLGPLSRSAQSNPESVLAGRFASGEIDDEEYRRRLDILRGHGKA